jgi:hypothetical protein
LKVFTAVPIIRRIALALGIVGCVFFASAFLVSVIDPGFVEQVAKNIIRYEVEKTVQEKIDAIDAHFLARKAEVFAKGYADDIARTKRLLIQRLPARIAEVIAEMQDLDCECRKTIETRLRQGFEWRIASASAAWERLTLLIRSRYMETARQITREFRIFTGTNALVFALLVFAAFARRQAGLHLLPAAFVLLAAASITACLYLFNQNWLHTLVFNEFAGWAYLGYLGAVFALLCDIIFNHARVTAEILNSILNAAGSTIQVFPC